MGRTIAAAVLCTVLTSAATVQAADRDTGTAETTGAVTHVAALDTALAGDVDWSLAPVKFGADSRGALLPALYVSLAALNAYDAYSTTKGLSLGAGEGNAMMRSVAGRPALLWAVKGGVTAGSVFIAERLWKKNNKVGAVAVMLATNGMMATVAARNNRVINSLR
jgi:hypothetical protein